MHGSPAKVLLPGTHGQARRASTGGGAGGGKVFTAAKGRVVQALERLGCAGILGVSERRRRRVDAKLGRHGGGPGGGGISGGVGDALGVEGSRQRGVENREGLAVSVDGGEAEAQPRGIVVARGAVGRTGMGEASGVGGGGEAVVEARPASELVRRLATVAVGICRVIGRYAIAVQARCQGAGGGRG